jgi:hypothetical protein
LHLVCLELLYFSGKFGIFPMFTEFLVLKTVVCDIFNYFLKIFSEGNNFGFEAQEFVDNPTEQGKPCHPLHTALQ